MAVPLACATVLGTTGRQDVSVPSGTTVAGLMAMLRIDLTDGVVLTRSDGVPADPGSVIGADLPSGVVLSVNDSRESSPSAQRSAARQSRDAWFRPVLVLTVLLGLLGLAEALTVVMPLRGVWQPPARVRLGAAALTAGGILALMRTSRARRTPWLLMVLSLLLGAAATGLITPASSLAPSLLAPVGAVGALTGCLLLWLLGGDVVASTLAAVWGAVTALTLALSWTGTPLRDLAPVALALAVLACVSVPALALKVPDTQLLDLPLVTTSATTVRAPEVRAPSRITAPRVNRTLREASLRADTLLTVFCLLACVSAPATASLMETSTWPGRCAIALMATAALAMAVFPRNRRERCSRILPRASALALLLAASRSPAVTRVLDAQGLAVVLLATGLVAVGGCLLVTRGEASALVGRVADLLESFCVLVVLPSAVVAAGLFDLIRRVAS
ncbi:hypothetical protein [Actinomyces sp. oral taxon 897]|jgi:hypothetical protein|uniref:hypothetical protein n=1 Tax=Actinomyces sp. oral taxon 897 TaxID=2081702 RepID=UPI000D03BE2A|nr:hypothetical protein [Actinomyces sp. oral taxon 897]AVM60743.1 hypothetical protein C3V41_00070 [Actinomyces sp. oral taxon 897]